MCGKWVVLPLSLPFQTSKREPINLYGFIPVCKSLGVYFNVKKYSINSDFHFQARWSARPVGLGSIFFIKLELTCRVLRAHGIILNFKKSLLLKANFKIISY